MKLLPEEINEILVLIDQYNFRDKYSLVKRKGWVFIEINGDGFAFHRKKKTTLKEGEFIDSTHYFVRVNKNEYAVDDFNQVLPYLSQWLNSRS